VVARGNLTKDLQLLINFDEPVKRLLMLFAAPPEKDLEWSEAGAEGASRFLGRVWRIVYKWRDKLSGAAEGEFSSEARSLRRKTHRDDPPRHARHRRAHELQHRRRRDDGCVGKATG
jgi:leucyl-tRNA synthetase